MALANRLKDFFLKRMIGRRRVEQWPFLPGKYYILDDSAPVIVVMPDNEPLAESLVALSVRGLCMVSPVCRSVADIEKLTVNVEANMAIHGIVLAGGEDRAYPAMEALTAIFGGNDEISEKAASLAHAVRGKLKSFDFAALESRVRIENLLSCVDVDKIIAAVNKLASDGIRPSTGFVVQSYDSTLGVERVIAPTDISHDLQADKAGSYVIGVGKKSIVIEHHNSKGELLRLIEGANARDLCVMLIRNGWISRLDHAAYLGRELTLAEIALQKGLPYKQDQQTRDAAEPTSSSTQ